MRVITKTRDTCELNTPFKVGSPEGQQKARPCMSKVPGSILSTGGKKNKSKPKPRTRQELAALLVGGLTPGCMSPAVGD